MFSSWEHMHIFYIFLDLTHVSLTFLSFNKTFLSISRKSLSDISLGIHNQGVTEGQNPFPHFAYAWKILSYMTLSYFSWRKLQVPTWWAGFSVTVFMIPESLGIIFLICKFIWTYSLNIILWRLNDNVEGLFISW